MAISQVRAQINGTWYTLTYNSATGKYEANITANAVSSGQTGGYFPVTVEAKSSDGQTATLSGTAYPGLRLVVEDTVAPTLTVTAPANNLVTAASTITVSGTAVDTSGIASVTINGTAVTVAADGSFSKTVSLSGGSNTITVKATDTVGNATTVTRTVTRATAGPTLTITSPAAGALLQVASVAVSGTVSDSVSAVASVTVNGVAATISGTSWTATVPLSEGANTITVAATNQVGLSTTATRAVTRDSTAPVLTLTAPANNFVTAAEAVTVSGTVSDAGAVTVQINGTPVTLSGGAFSLSVPLAGGSNTIAVTATDAAGNVTTETRTVARATQGPAVTILSPVEGFITNEGTVLVSGTVSDSVALVSGVTVNGVTASLSSGTFSASVPLTEGANTITVVGVNSVDLSTTETVSGTLDTVPPSIVLTSPTAGEMTGSTTFTVKGRASDSRSGLESVTINDTAVTVNGTGSFTVEVLLAEGNNVIIAVATDRAGNTATATGSVLLDTIPPVLTVAYPAGDIITNDPALTVTGTASDSGSGLERVTVNGQEAPVSGGTFSLGLTLQEGENTVTVIAVDRVGLTTTITRSVLLDTQEPVLTLVSPPEGWLSNDRPTVVFQAADEPGGSGLDMDTVSITLDGAVQSQGVTVSGGTITYTPSAALSDGQHVITVTIQDRAGNTRGLSATYGIDTLPPELTIKAPWLHYVVDWESVEVSGLALDLGSGVASVKVNGAAVAVESDGAFSAAVPLEVGENTITVTATDMAGLSTTQTLWMLRLITDRTQADVDYVTTLYGKVWDDFTPGEKAFWQGVVRGAYNDTDMNRVGAAVEYIAQYLQQAGYAPGVTPKTDWTEEDAPTPEQRQTYLDNVAALKALLPISEPDVPPDMEEFHFTEANDIEAILVAADRLFPLMERSIIYSGEAFAGEF